MAAFKPWSARHPPHAIETHALSYCVPVLRTFSIEDLEPVTQSGCSRLLF
jgi:hypothetical protein